MENLHLERDGEGGYPTRIVQPSAPTSPKPPEKVLSFRRKLGVASKSEVTTEDFEEKKRDGQTASTELPGHIAQTPSFDLKSQNELSDDDDSSSEASSLESEDSSDDEEHGLGSLDLHPAHSQQLAGPTQPVSLPGCTDAHQMAIMAAADTKVGIRQTRLASCKASKGELLVSSKDFSATVRLINSFVCVEPCTGSFAKGQTVVCIVDPTSTIKRTSSQRSRRPSSSGVVGMIKEVFSPNSAKDREPPKIMPETAGWLFYCPMAELSCILAMLAENGCHRSGLSKCYKAMRGESLGSGTFGTVVAATDLQRDAPTAIKHLKDGCKSEVVEHEVEMLVKAQGHANIIKFHGCFRETHGGKTKYSIVFDYYNHGDLYDRVARGKTFTEKTAMTPFKDLLEALKFLHEHTIFHRDVKPENLLVANASCKVVLTDFGIATLLGNTEEMKKSAGTVGYASPEMLRGASTGFEGDAFGAGVVLFFLLSRSTPFLAPTSALMAEKTQACHINLKYGCFEHVSDDCRSLMLKLMEKDVQARMTVEQALSVNSVRKVYSTATEPALVSLAEKKKNPLKMVCAQDSLRSNQSSLVPTKPAHHMIALSVGELPALRMPCKK